MNWTSLWTGAWNSSLGLGDTLKEWESWMLVAESFFHPWLEHVVPKTPLPALNMFNAVVLLFVYVAMILKIRNLSWGLVSVVFRFFLRLLIFGFLFNSIVLWCIWQQK